MTWASRHMESIIAIVISGVVAGITGYFTGMLAMSEKINSTTLEIERTRRDFAQAYDAKHELHAYRISKLEDLLNGKLVELEVSVRVLRSDTDHIKGDTEILRTQLGNTLELQYRAPRSWPR